MNARRQIARSLSRQLHAVRASIPHDWRSWWLARALLLVPAFGVLLIAALWFALSIRLETDRSETLYAAMRSTESEAAAFAEYVAGELRDIDRTTLIIAAQFERDGTVDLRSLVRRNLVPVGGPFRISVNNAAGYTIATTDAGGMPINVADRPFFRLHAMRDTGVLDISQVMPSRRTGEPEIKLSRRLNGAGGRFAGIVTISVGAAYFANFYSEPRLGRQGMVAVLGMDGIYRVRRSGGRVEAAQDGSATPVFAAARAQSEGSFTGTSAVDGTRRMLAYRRLADYPLIVMAARAEDEVLARFEQRQRTYVLASTVATAMIVAFFATITALAYVTRRRIRERRRQTAFLEAFIDHVPLGVVVRSAGGQDAGKVKVWNRAAEGMFDVTAKKAVGGRLDRVLPKTLASAMAARDREMLASPMVQDALQAVDAPPQAAQRVYRIISAPVFDASDAVEHVVSLLQDVSAEQARAAELRLNAKVFEATGDAIMLTDADDRVIAVNPAFTRITGFAAGEMVGVHAARTPFRAPDAFESESLRAHALAQGCVTAEVLCHHKDGGSLPMWLTMSLVRDEVGAIANFVRVFTDISTLKDAQKRLEDLASHDSLTGLLNRRMFHEQFERALQVAARRGRGAGLLFIDLDDFKAINDSHGHDAGDSVLREVARRVQHSVRATDTVCRIGGDEFTVIIEDARLPEDAETMSARIAAMLEVPFHVGGRTFACSASIGIALFPDHGTNADALVACADRAMYLAKHVGHRRWAMATN